MVHSTPDKPDKPGIIMIIILYHDNHDKPDILMIIFYFDPKYFFAHNLRSFLAI